MSLDVRRPILRRRAVTALLLLAAGLFTASVATAAPAAAASSADLAVTLTNRTAVPGHRVTYVVTVTNHGPSAAQKVQIDFTTNTNLNSPYWSITSGKCYRSPRETACLFGTLKAGQTGRATIFGTMSKKVRKGHAVSSKVTVASNTPLVGTTNDVATLAYRVGEPRTVAAAPSPTPTPSEGAKITSIKNAATDAVSVTRTALIWSVVALGAAALWFAVGLTLRRRKRRRNPSPDLY